MVLSWARQVAALAKKELLLLLRAPKKSVTELVAPVLVVVPLHQASMEEVFLLIAHRAAEAHAAATSKAKDGAVDV